MLKKGMPLENLNSDDSLFAIDYNSNEFKSLDKKQKHTLI